jgi:transposase
MWCIPKLTPEYRERMEDLITLYIEALPPGHEVHCFDEASKQLLETPRGNRPHHPGQIKRTDYEYKRNGTRNLFVAVNPFAGTRTVTVTKRRTLKRTTAFLWRYCMKTHRQAIHIHLVLDNLNTHGEKALRRALGEKKAKLFFIRVTIHYTPKHASWLNMAELEINCLRAQGVKRRLADETKLRQVVQGITHWRNDRQRTINWSFIKQKAQEKFPELYRGDTTIGN